jgi:hypothetical protein
MRRDNSELEHDLGYLRHEVEELYTLLSRAKGTRPEQGVSLNVAEPGDGDRRATASHQL